MKNLITLFLITTSIAYSQETIFTFENFESEFLKYEPVQKENVSDNNFGFGKNIIEETKKSIANNGNIYNFQNYWNIATALSTLKENNEYIEIAFKKATEFDKICQYIKIFENEKNHFNRQIPEIYELQKTKCANKIVANKPINLEEYSIENNLDLNLVNLMSKIRINDQFYRTSDLEYKTNLTKQNELDLNNRRIIDSLFIEHKKYIGKSLVREKFETGMWSIIQHSNLVMMEKYLPIIQKAVSENELHLTAFKMLLDRIHSIKYDYQFFGSQPGIRMADERKINEIKEKYGIN
ncbi:MAG: hypothetical protein A3F91_12800 [Flavobacteria bacterium RIFCSPLOWO2_12_FULL_35_11]|nr:MAG: hypothetical protein A3F91_12800 [Flavobacteria bacterium RIFCSPLOWO2_12_FULL_35_11]